MFERHSQRGRQVIVLAQQEARELGRDYIGTEHLLIAALRPEVGVVARATRGRAGAGAACLPRRGRRRAARILADASADGAAIRAGLVRVYVDRPEVFVDRPEVFVDRPEFPAVAPPVEILPELDGELGWRGRPIALAALGAAMLARSAFDPRRAGLLAPIEIGVDRAPRAPGGWPPTVPGVDDV